MIRFLFLILSVVSCAPLGNRSIILPPGQDYMTINSGRVHRSCLVRFGEKLPKLIDQSTQESQSCLKKLKTSNSNGIAARLQKIYDQKAITYVCNQDTVGKYIAKASLDPAYDDPKTGLKYPYVSFNPKHVLSDSDVKGESLTDYNVKSVLFHETIHFLGYRHRASPEYAYACEECCFPYYNGDQDKACKICSTGYKNVSDDRYLKDFWEWADKSDFAKPISRHHVIRNALVLRPASEKHLKIFLENSTENSMTAHFFSLKIPQKEYTRVTSARVFKSESKMFEPIAKNIADIQYLLYYKGDVNGAYKKIMKLDTSVLKDGLKFKGKTYDYAYSVWDWLLYDLDVAATYYDQRFKKEAAKKVWDKWDEVQAYLD